MAEWSQGWIKLYHEIIIDDKMGVLSDHLWRRAIECMLAAGAEGRGGYLPEIKALARKLATTEAELEADLTVLAAPGVKIVEKRPDGWYVTSHLKRQVAKDPTNARRQAAYRERQKTKFAALHAPSPEPLRNALDNALNNALRSIEDKKDISPPAPAALPEKPLSEQQQMFGAIAEVCKLDPKLKAGMIAKNASALLKASYRPEEVLAFRGWWESDPWRMKNMPVPSLADLLNKLPQSREWATRRNGHNREVDRNDWADDPQMVALRRARGEI